MATSQWEIIRNDLNKSDRRAEGNNMKHVIARSELFAALLASGSAMSEAKESDRQPVSRRQSTVFTVSWLSRSRVKNTPALGCEQPATGGDGRAPRHLRWWLPCVRNATQDCGKCHIVRPGSGNSGQQFPKRGEAFGSRTVATAVWQAGSPPHSQECGRSPIALEF